MTVDPHPGHNRHGGRHGSGKSSRNRDWQFHPYEFAFCGYSGAGKTTLVERLLHGLSGKYKIGYVKHDAHRFEMDREGKDTFRARASGAAEVFISDANHHACITAGSPDLVAQRTALANCDFVFVEGYKESPIPKLLVLDEDEGLAAALLENGLSRVLGCIGSRTAYSGLPSNLPYFHRDAVQDIQDFLLGILEEAQGRVPLYGLVLAGGYSTRMHAGDPQTGPKTRDKALLEYHGLTQARHCHALLSRFCANVFVSLRSDQSKDDAYKDLPQIADTFLGMGPMGGVLSALSAHPETAWLVLACDLPYVGAPTLARLVEERKPFKTASAYLSLKDGLPEPLCAIYEPKSRLRLLQFLGLGYNCPRKFLIHSDIQAIAQAEDSPALLNVNTLEEYSEARAYFGKNGVSGKPSTSFKPDK